MVHEFHYKASVGHNQEIFGFGDIVCLGIMIVQYLDIGIKLLFKNFILQEILCPEVDIYPGFCTWTWRFEVSNT